MTEMIETLISERWSLYLPDHRANRFTDDGTPLWPTWEKERIAAMHDAIRSGDVVFDIGTEEGDISALLATWVGEEGEICLFEPNPKVWPNIKAIWESNGLKTPRSFWVGFASDVDEFYPRNLNIDMTVVDGWPQCAYGPLIGDHGFRHLAQEADATPQIKIDSFCSRNQVEPDLITMDIEGAEMNALRGASQILRDCHPLVFVSIHPEFMTELYGVGRETVLNFMSELGYEADLLAIDHEEHWAFT